MLTFYAPDPPSQLVCTIGGNVAENSGGAHCLKFGFTVTHVLALEVALPSDELVQLGSSTLAILPELKKAHFIQAQGATRSAIASAFNLLKLLGNDMRRRVVAPKPDSSLIAFPALSTVATMRSGFAPVPGLSASVSQRFATTHKGGGRDVDLRAHHAACFTVLLFAATLPAQTPDATAPSNEVSKIRIVRLSEVKGEVQMDRDTGRGFERAMANLPVVEKESIADGHGGRRGRVRR